MSSELVEAVLIVRYNKSNFRALFGRLSGTAYTKDYIQIPEAVSQPLRKLFGASENNVDVMYVWPTGTQAGQFSWSADRYHLKWGTDTPPKPWTIGDPNTEAEISIKGNPDRNTESTADREFDAIEAGGSKPWLVATKLFGEGNRLHIRVYFENPPPMRSDRGLNVLPKIIQDEIRTLRATAGTGIVDLSSNAVRPKPTGRAKKLLAQVLVAIERDPNVLLIGPPGTGKSVALEDLRDLFTPWVAAGSIMFDPNVWGPAWSTASESRCESLVFHPSYGYENFVAGLFPKAKGGSIELEAKPGPMLCLSHWVGGSERRALLVLDEFNRGSAAAIFGDTLSLLDKDKRSSPSKHGAHIQRPYATHPMPVPGPYTTKPGATEEIAQTVYLPMGVCIVAAMNSTDRSVAPVDAAMRRRFTVIRVRPDYETLAEHLGIEWKNGELRTLPTDTDPSNWSREEVAVLAIRLLQALNERIEFCLGEDFLLGHALVWHLKASSAIELLAELAIAVDTKVVPTLRMTFVDQDEALAAILGVPDSATVQANEDAPKDKVAYWRLAPAALSAIAPRRLAVNLIHEMSPKTQLAALKSLRSD